MADKFMQNDKPEVGYFAKRKDQFNKSIQDGINFATNTKTSKVRNKPKHDTSKKKATPKKDNSDVPPNQLKGKDFAERMRLAREAKQKEGNKDEKSSS